MFTIRTNNQKFKLIVYDGNMYYQRNFRCFMVYHAFAHNKIKLLYIECPSLNSFKELLTNQIEL